MKPFYSVKGKYPDGRKKIIIVRKAGKNKTTWVLPKPEILIQKWDTLKEPLISVEERDT